MAIPVPTERWHGNQWYPLSPDYFEQMTKGTEQGWEAARKARVEACRQWSLTRAQVAGELEGVVPGWAGKGYEERQRLVDEYLADAMVASVRFFDEWYLKPDRAAGFDPLFYDQEPLETPGLHWDLFKDWAVNDASLAVAPRGSGKSVCFRKAFILVMLSKSSYKILYCTSSEKNAMETAEAVRSQLYTNKRVQEDWGPEMPNGYVRPKRSEAPTGIEWFKLTNGSQLVTYSVNSKMRGGRPSWFALDDPEHDPSASTSMSVIRAYMSRLLFKIALPMLMRKESRLSWTATFVSKRHFAFMAMETVPVKQGDRVVKVARIAEFDYWKRRVIKACVMGEDGKLVSCWPEMWPVDEEEKRRLGLDPSTKTLAQIKKMIGSQNFSSEYMANPGASEEVYFKLREEMHSWWVLSSSVDGDFVKEPRKSQAIIKWRSGEAEKSAKLCEFLRAGRMFITVDTSKTARSDSDYKAATLMLVNEDHDLFVLDVWQGQCHPDKLMEAVFEMSRKWGCKWIWPELIDDGIVLARSMRNAVAQRAKAGVALGELPVVKGFNPGFTRKSAKIGALLMRFEHGKIKLPFYLRMRRPWVDLFDQIEGFNPDVDDGGLQYDDLLDTVSASEYVVGGRTPKEMLAEETEVDVLKLIGRGETVARDGTPLVQFLDFSKLTAEQARVLVTLGEPKKVKGGLL